MQITGIIKQIQPTQVVSDKFKKRDLWLTIEHESQYPQVIAVQFQQEKCDILDKYAQGQLVEIGINLRGREWQNKEGETVVFNTIQGWKISEVGQGSTPQPEAAASLVGTSTVGGDNELPF